MWSRRLTRVAVVVGLALAAAVAVVSSGALARLLRQRRGLQHCLRTTGVHEWADLIDAAAGGAAAGGDAWAGGGIAGWVRSVLPVKPFVVAIVALWDEALTLPLSLDSTRHVVDEYIVIHKVGTDNTAEVLRRCIDKWGLRVQYFASNMTLRDARMFAIRITQAYADYYIIQDGDEVFYNSGPTAIQDAVPLLAATGAGSILSKMVYLKHTLTSTLKDSYAPGKAGKWGGHAANGIMLIDHPTVLRNDGNIVMPASLTEDVPYAGGRDAITLHAPWKFDVSIKHPLREFLRGSFLDWSRAGSPGTIEEWAAANDAFHAHCVAAGRAVALADTAALYVTEQLPSQLQNYSETEWFPYPAAIRKYIDAGRLRGYDGGDIL